MALRTWLAAGFWFSLLLLAGPAPRTANAADSDYVKDVESACDQIKQACAVLLKSKKIDWKKVTKEFRKEAKGVSSDEEPVLLVPAIAVEHVGCDLTHRSLLVNLHAEVGSSERVPGSRRLREGSTSDRS